MDSDRVKGAAKEAEGKLTGDEVREAEGEGQGTWGKAKDTGSDALDETKDKAEDAKDKLT